MRGYIYNCPTHDSLHFRTYIINRPDERLTEDSTGCGLMGPSGNISGWYAEYGNFPTPWVSGEPAIAVIDRELNSGSIDHTGLYAVINDTCNPLVDPQDCPVCTLRTIPAPDTVSTTGGKVELIWDTPPEDSGIPPSINIIGYNVYRGHDGVNFPVKLNTNIVTDTFYTDSTASIGDSLYYYAIKLVYRGIPDTIESRYFSQNSPLIATGIEEKSTITNEIAKLKIYPNPFAEKTAIEFGSSGVMEFNSQLSNSSTPQLNIYDVSGRLVKQFTINDSRLTDVTWDGRDNTGREVSPGLYFVHLKAGDYGEIRKVIKLH